MGPKEIRLSPRFVSFRNLPTRLALSVFKTRGNDALWVKLKPISDVILNNPHLFRVFSVSISPVKNKTWGEFVTQHAFNQLKKSKGVHGEGLKRQQLRNNEYTESLALASAPIMLLVVSEMLDVTWSHTQLPREAYITHVLWGVSASFCPAAAFRPLILFTQNSQLALFTARAAW